MLTRTALLLVALFAAPVAFGGDISGFWQHADEPGWIEINLDKGKGIVVRNDKYPQRVGREILRDLVADESKQGLWSGQVFAEKLGEYKDAEISLAGPDRMTIKVKVGFMSRTVEWQRVDAVPGTTAN